LIREYESRENNRYGELLPLTDEITMDWTDCVSLITWLELYWF
jgi:hypothetical protein